MPDPYDPNNFAGRVSVACDYIRAGRDPGQEFDACYQMGDGDAVAVAVWRWAEREPVIMARLQEYMGVGEKLAAVVARYAGVPDGELWRAAKAMREKSGADHRRARASWEAADLAASDGQLSLI